MGTQVIENVAEVGILYLQQDQQTENVIHCYNPNGWNITKAEALRDAIEAWCIAEWCPVLPNSTQAVGIRFVDLTSLAGYAATLPFDANHAGTGGASGTNNTTFCLSKIIAERYKGGHPRLYQPGVTIADVSNSRYTVAEANGIRAALDGLITAVGAVDGGDVVYGVLRTTGLGATHDAPRFAIVNGHRYADLVVDSQRRRLPGRGR